VNAYPNHFVDVNKNGGLTRFELRLEDVAAMPLESVPTRKALGVVW